MKLVNIFSRYLILILLGINLNLFYFIFTPLTVYSVFFLLNIFFSVSLSGITISLNNFNIKIVEACIAGSAYYLLAILNLTTKMKIKKRVLSLLFLFSSFFVINVFRIFLFSAILLKSFSLFNTLHLITWYFLSGIIVFLIWVLNIKIFNIKKVPVYSDLRFLFNIKKD